jgi:hypothetical protein
MGISKIQIAITPPLLATVTSYFVYIYIYIYSSPLRGVKIFACPPVLGGAYSKQEPIIKKVSVSKYFFKPSFDMRSKSKIN